MGGQLAGRVCRVTGDPRLQSQRQADSVKRFRDIHSNPDQSQGQAADQVYAAGLAPVGRRQSPVLCSASGD
jgi:hypothetical protein